MAGANMEEGTRFEVDYKVEFSNFYHAMRWYAWRKFWWQYCVLIFSVPAGVLIATFYNNIESTVVLLLASFIAMSASVLVAGLLYWGIYRNARKQYRTSNT